ncbi:MAG: hypothetical protein NTV80_24715 [Verrucomicrobia bacterium]|nr:hypothetical protein [Verrucomicrobiota bacterium]
MGEKESAEKTVELFAAILAGLTMPEIHETIIHNAALIVACSRFTNPNAEELPGLLEVAYREVKRAMTHHL